MPNVAGEDELGELSDPASDFGSDSGLSSSSLDMVFDTSSGTGCDNDSGSDSDSDSEQGHNKRPEGIEGCKCIQGIAGHGLKDIEP